VRRRLVGQRGRDELVGIGEADAVVVEPVGGLDPGGEAEVDRLGAVDRRAAADTQQRVGPRLAGRRRRLDHRLARDVLADPGEDAGEPVAERGAELVAEPTLNQRRRGDREDPLGADPLGDPAKLGERAGAVDDLGGTRVGKAPVQRSGLGAHRQSATLRPGSGIRSPRRGRR
jgi:hypothetical protein